jgi:hypothetical protein
MKALQREIRNLKPFFPQAVQDQVPNFLLGKAAVHDFE